MSNDSSIIVNTRGVNDVDNKTKQNQTTESHISTKMFILQLHLQNLITLDNQI